MKKTNIILFLFFAICFATLSHAQQLQTFYYANGSKAMEGRWKYQNNIFLPNNFLHMIFSNERDEESRLYSFVDKETHEAQLLFLSLSFDGPVTAWYKDGSKKLEAHFANGTANGAYQSYYKNGKTAVEGKLTNGFPDGLWNEYDEEGQLVFSGNYTPLTQEDMAARWQKLMQGIDSRHSPLEEEMPIPPYQSSDSVMAQYRIDGFFRQFNNLCAGHARRNGIFSFYNDGAKSVQLSYRNDIRQGDWIIYRRGRVIAAISYDNGKVVSVTDSNGNKRTFAAAFAEELKNLEEEKEGRKKQQEIAASQKPVFTMVEQMPEFPGDVNKYVAEHLQYTKQMKKEGIEGKVVVRFVINTDGTVGDVKVTKSLCKTCDEEAVRVIKSMPKWKPGKQNGRAVDTYFNLPVTFRKQ